MASARNRIASSFCALILGAAVALLTATPETPAFEAKTEDGRLQRKEFFHDELYISSSNAKVELSERGALSGDAALEDFVDAYGSDFHLFMDPRSGTLTAIIGRVPLIPGSGVDNSRKLADLAQDLGRLVTTVDESVVGAAVQQWVIANASLIGIDADQLGSVKAAKITDTLWHVNIVQELDGIPVRHGRVAATINHGNLIVVGTETWGNVVLDTEPLITAKHAVSIGFAWAEGRESVDEIWKEPALEIIPYAPKEHQSGDTFIGDVGQGYGHRLVWAFGFRRSPALEAWEVLVDAHTGELISFEDTTVYAEEPVVGGVYPLTNIEICPTNETCGTLQPGYPMPFAYTGLAAPNDVTNSAGLYDYPGGTVTFDLSGPYVSIDDTCGTVSESTTAGPLDLGGVNGDHDCTTPGGGRSPAPRRR